MRSLIRQPLYTERSDGVAIIDHPYRVGFVDEWPIVKRGTQTDWATVPRIVERLRPGTKADLGRPGPLVHDALYESAGGGGRFTREECDRILLGLMVLDGVNPDLAWLAYRAVRAGGRHHWAGNQEEDHAMNIAALIPIAQAVYKALQGALGAEIINHAIDRYVAGTERNKWDDAAWALVERLLEIDQEQHAEVAAPVLAEIQAEFDAAKLAGEVPSAPVG